MRRIVALFALLIAVCSCGVAPEPTAEKASAFTCAARSSFTHVCTRWVPSMIQGSPANSVPLGDPQWCASADSAPPAGWMTVINDQPAASNRYCASVPPGSYGNLGDWDYTSPLPNQIPSVHVRQLVTGPQSYAFVWDQPNFGGNFVGFYPPGSVATFDGDQVGSFELIQGS